jgi:hypothetical protein
LAHGADSLDGRAVPATGAFPLREHQVGVDEIEAAVAARG